MLSLETLAFPVETSKLADSVANPALVDLIVAAAGATTPRTLAESAADPVGGLRAAMLEALAARYAARTDRADQVSARVAGMIDEVKPLRSLARGWSSPPVGDALLVVLAEQLGTWPDGVIRLTPRGVHRFMRLRLTASETQSVRRVFATAVT